MAARFEVRKSTNGQYYFNLKAVNGEVILTGETYISKSAVLGAINSVKANAPTDSRYERKSSMNGQSYFVLKARNGETLGESEMYSSMYGTENGIMSVRINAPIALLVDLT